MQCKCQVTPPYSLSRLGGYEMAAGVGLRYPAMVWLVDDVAVDDLAIKSPWLVSVASA